MSHVNYIEHAVRDEILQQMVTKRAPVVLTRQGPDGWLVVKSRFCGANAEQGWLAVDPPLAQNGGPEWTTPSASEYLGISFRRGHKKYVFNAPACAPDELHQAKTPSKPTIFIRWPENVQELQRRVYQRACPPQGRQISVEIQTAEANSGPNTTITGTMEDLSAGGMRVRCAHPVDLKNEVKLLFALRSNGDMLSFDGTFRHCQATDQGDYSIGFQYIGMETSQAGQEQLHHIARVVTDFQRAAIRQRPRNLRRSPTRR